MEVDFVVLVVELVVIVELVVFSGRISSGDG